MCVCVYECISVCVCKCVCMSAGVCVCVYECRCVFETLTFRQCAFRKSALSKATFLVSNLFATLR